MKKKDLEKAFLEEVKKLDPEFPSGQIIDSESPDFVIKLDTETLGIEIIRYMRGQNSGESALRRSEVVSQKIIENAKTEFYKSSEVPLWVLFSWYPSRYPPQSEVLEFANIAVWAIGNNIPYNLFESFEIPNNYFEGTAIKKYLRRIKVTRVRNERQVLWSSIESGHISAVPDEIQEIISSKNAKAKQYKEKCDLLWLIIVADGKHISSTASLEESALNHMYQSEFDRIVFYDHQEHKMKNLTIKIDGQI